MSGFISLAISCGFSGSDIAQEKDKNIFEILSNKGWQVTLESNVNPGLMNKVKAIVYDVISKKLEKAYLTNKDK